ncbi:hypothetical protein [Paraburkholderia kururiensis]|uniref:Uncharacterized protein n=1 Tax=Paraburkholderia kururiensis TaxID=984307 RepID=A0ABZ0WMW3_9BURK|nr:hypothetical protein [Paraburkholderia kururiensis]WQD78703.1 hypothetical protein U0042_03055 [Paraburkholderia kururiensis]
MTMTAIRQSDTAVQVDDNVYTFGTKDDADAFLRCVADTSLDACKARHVPLSVQSAAPKVEPEDPNRGSTISPSLGGMP